MAVYKNLTQNSPLSAVEFTPVSDGNFSFFYVDSPLKKDGVKHWLASPEMGQEIIAETQVDGHPVIITHGDKPQAELQKILEARGNKLELQLPKKSMDLWKAIALLAVPGQTLQLTSSLMRKRKDWALFSFAASNLLGHVIGWVYGSQKSPDDHRLHYLKEQFNTKLDGHLPAGATLPSAEEDLSVLRDEPKAPLSSGQKANAWLQKNSVTVGEILLRYFGAFSLAFPVDRWKSGLGKFRSEGMGAALKEAGNRQSLVKWAGLGSLTGKTIALASKVPDPYDPKPHTWLDTVREKITFRAGGWVEAASWGTMAFNAFTAKNRQTADYLSGIGSTLFTIRYIVRNWAKYGEKKVDMDELYAHVSDGLAKTSPDQLPQLMADTAASLKEHFKDKPIEFGKIYTQMMTDLYRYHHIAFDNLGTEPEERLATTTTHTSVQGKHTLKHPRRVVASHTETIAGESSPSQLGIGA